MSLDIVKIESIHILIIVILIIVCLGLSFTIGFNEGLDSIDNQFNECLDTLIYCRDTFYYCENNFEKLIKECYNE